MFLSLKWGVLEALTGRGIYPGNLNILSKPLLHQPSRMNSVWGLRLHCILFKLLVFTALLFTARLNPDTCLIYSIVPTSSISEPCNISWKTKYVTYVRYMDTDFIKYIFLIVATLGSGASKYLEFLLLDYMLIHLS